MTMMIKTEDYHQACGCRSVGECNHNWFIENQALDDLVDAFGERMKSKLRRKFMEGYTGWDDPENFPTKRLIESLKAHIEKGDMVDVANLAMMIWNRGRRG